MASHTIAKDIGQALYELTELTAGRDETEQVQTVERLIVMLEAEGRVHLLSAVLREYERLLSRVGAEHRLAVYVAKPDDIDRFKDMITRDAQTLGDTSDREVKVDPSIVGGYILTANGRRMDQSYRRKLIALYRELSTT